MATKARKSNVIPFYPSIAVVPRAASPPPEWVRVDIKLLGRCWQPFVSARWSFLHEAIEQAYEFYGMVELKRFSGNVRAITIRQ